MNPPKRVTDDELSAYIDGELHHRDRSRVEAWLANNPDEMARIETYRRQNDALRSLHHAVINSPVPAKMLDMLEAPVNRRQLPVWGQVAAALLLMVLGGAGGWSIRDWREEPTVVSLPSFVERAVGAHFVYTSEVLHPVEVEADREDHLVAWLSKRLGNPLKAPRLDSIGYQLVGGRLLEDTGTPAAQFMYEDTAGRRITVYMRSYDGRDTAFKFFQSGDIAAFYWIDAPFAYALAGELPRADLMEISRIVYKNLPP